MRRGRPVSPAGQGLRAFTPTLAGLHYAVFAFLMLKCLFAGIGGNL
jgi:hypothetical protein